jgi:hypothetical protein
MSEPPRTHFRFALSDLADSLGPAIIRVRALCCADNTRASPYSSIFRHPSRCTAASGWWRIMLFHGRHSDRSLLIDSQSNASSFSFTTVTVASFWSGFTAIFLSVQWYRTSARLCLLLTPGWLPCRMIHGPCMGIARGVKDWWASN